MLFLPDIARTIYEYVLKIEFRKRIRNLFDPFAHDLSGRFPRFEFRLLFEIADRRARHKTRFARKISIALRKCRLRRTQRP